MARLESGRMKLRIQEVSYKLDQLNKLIEACQGNIEEQRRRYETASLAAQLRAFYELSEHYAELLESAASSWDTGTVHLIRDGIDARELKIKRAMRLFAQIVSQNTEIKL